ncbi:MAG: hypothetical protein ACAF42_14305 [Limnothrix sp. BL-A-16]
MTQENFNFDEETVNSFWPAWTARKFPSKQDLGQKARTLLAYLKNSEEPRTKEEMAMAIYPLAFRDDSRDTPKPFWDGYCQRNPVDDAKKIYTKRVAQVISKYRSSLRQQLYKMEKSYGREQVSIWLRDYAEIILPVGETDSGAWLYAYHGPDHRCSQEALMKSHELALQHKDSQDLHLKLSEKIMAANHLPVSQSVETRGSMQLDVFDMGEDHESDTNENGSEQANA